MPPECPDRETLQRLLLGDLPATERERWAQHLLECDACVSASDTIIASDELTEAIRARRVIEGDDDLVSQVIERGLQLRTSIDSQCLDETTDGERSVLDETYDSSTGTTSSGHHEAADFLADPEQPGEIGRLGGYRVLEVMGAGGMGIVLKAEDPKLERLVALKAMKPAVAASRTSKDRFLREAKATAAIEHHNIVQIYQVGEDRNVPFIAMQFLRGESLQHRLSREGKLEQREVLRIGKEVAAGLQAAHDTGLIHRDIKPDNIWIDEKTGSAKILDFGLVRSADDDAGLTHSGVVVGTPRYMAPEQAQGEPVDHRSDLFSLGSVLYHLVTGRPAFIGSNLTATLIAVAQASPLEVSQVSPDLHPDLAKLIMGLLSKEKDIRPQSASEVAEFLAAIEIDLELEPTMQVVPRTAAPPAEDQVTQDLAPPETQAAQSSASGGDTGSHRKLLIGGGTAALFLLAVIVFKFATPDGTVIVQLDTPIEIASVEVDEKQVNFSPVGSDKRLTFKVDPGDHKLSIKTKGGLELITELGSKPLEIKAGGLATLRAWVDRSSVVGKAKDEPFSDRSRVLFEEDYSTSPNRVWFANTQGESSGVRDKIYYKRSAKNGSFYSPSRYFDHPAVGDFDFRAEMRCTDVVTWVQLPHVGNGESSRGICVLLRPSGVSEVRMNSYQRGREVSQETLAKFKKSEIVGVEQWIKLRVVREGEQYSVFENNIEVMNRAFHRRNNERNLPGKLHLKCQATSKRAALFEMKSIRLAAISTRSDSPAKDPAAAESDLQQPLVAIKPGATFLRMSASQLTLQAVELVISCPTIRKIELFAGGGISTRSSSGELVLDTDKKKLLEKLVAESTSLEALDLLKVDEHVFEVAGFWIADFRSLRPDIRYRVQGEDFDKTFAPLAPEHSVDLDAGEGA